MLDTIQGFIMKALLALVALVACALVFGAEAAEFLLVAGLLAWIARRLWALWRLWESVGSAKGDETAMALEKLRFRSSLFRFLCNIVLIAAFILAMWVCLDAGMRFGHAAIASSIIAFLCGTPLWIKASRLWREYKDGFKSGFVAASLSGVFDKLSYNPDGEFQGENRRRERDGAYSDADPFPCSVLQCELIALLS